MEKGRLLAEGRTAEIFEWNEGYVLKLIRPGFPPELADREAETLVRVHALGIKCPAVASVVEVEGRRGIVLERVDGSSMLEAVMGRPRTAREWAATLAELHVQLHSEVAPYPPSQRDRLARIIRKGQALDPRTKELVLTHLDGLPDGKSVCHGDFHPGNVIMSVRGPVILDWIDATVGNPFGDVARTLLLLELGRPQLGFWRGRRFERLRTPFVRAYLERYVAVRSANRGDIELWRAPTAAARLEEEVPGERPLLLEIVRGSL